MESHYGQGQGTKGKKYLSSYLNVATMYDIYLQSMNLRNMYGERQQIMW